MFAHNGPRPESCFLSSRRTARHPHRPRRVIGLVVTLLCLFPGITPGFALTLDTAERRALIREPGALAHAARAAALQARAEAADALPAPSLRLGLNNYPIERGGFSTEGMTNAGVTWRQAFPPGDVRSLQRHRYEGEARAAAQDQASRERDVLLGVRQSWLSLYHAQRDEVLLRGTRPLFRDLLEVTRSLYAVGRRNQQDVLRVELELGRLEDRLVETRRRQAEALADLVRWTGPLENPSLPPVLPPPAGSPDPETLGSALNHHPRLLAMDARLAAQGSAVRLAEERRQPGWALDVGYAYRDGERVPGEPRSDFITVGVSMELPFLQGRALDNELRAALEDEDALSLEREALARQLAAQLSAQLARWNQLERRVALYDASILPQARATAEAAKLAYQADSADFADVMRAAIDELDIRLERLALDVERARTGATLAWLGGERHEH